MDITVAVIIFVLFAVSLIGIFIPFIPGVALAWLAFIIFIVTKGIFLSHIWLVSILTVITIVTLFSDTIFSIIGAKFYKSTKYGIIGGILGFCAGLFLFPPLGVIIGPFVGVYAGELYSGQKPEQALKSLWGAVLGFLVSVVLRVLLWFVFLFTMIFLAF